MSGSGFSWEKDTVALSPRGSPRVEPDTPIGKPKVQKRPRGRILLKVALIAVVPLVGLISVPRRHSENRGAIMPMPRVTAPAQPSRAAAGSAIAPHEANAVPKGHPARRVGAPVKMKQAPQASPPSELPLVRSSEPDTVQDVAPIPPPGPEPPRQPKSKPTSAAIEFGM